jgi:regulator of sigma E protease
MSIAITIIGFVVAILIMVTAHEFGHLLASKRIGVAVEEFGLGFPPRLFAFKRGETTYSVNLIPVGAFVKTPGESDYTVPDSLASKGPWARMFVYAAGPLVNVLVAFAVLSVFFMVPSDVVRGDGAMIHSVAEGSPAEEAGILAGDIILAIDGQEIGEWKDVQETVNSDEGEEKTLLLDRDGTEFELGVVPEFNPDHNRYTVGVLLSWGLVTGVAEGSPAEEADIRVGDTILAAGGKAVYSDETLLEGLGSGGEGQEVEFYMLRDEEVVSATLQTEAGTGLEAVGLENRWVSNTRLESQRLPVWKAIYRGGEYIVRVPYLVKESIPIIQDDPSKLAVGVVGAGQLTVEAVQSSGFSNMLLLAGMVSLGLALFNFIPIPPLDGGGMLIAFIEGVRRGKRLSPRTVRYAYIAGTALMIGVFVIIMYNDIARVIRSIVTGESGFGL